MSYRESLSQAMVELSKHQEVVFLGQGCLEKGTFMSTTLQDVPPERRIEMPVAEECQLGMSIGIALSGLVPVTIYPRFNFLLLATNQLVNHLDKLKPHVIVRVGVGSEKPLDPGPQHKGNFSAAFRQMMPNTKIVNLRHKEEIIPAYKEAFFYEGPTILVEVADFYEN